MRTIKQTEKGEVVELSSMELLTILMNQEKGTFCFLHMETVPSMRKTNNPYFNRVTKITKGNVLLGCNYQTRVSNNTKNPDFKPEENKVGEKVTKCIRHNEKFDRYYLDYEWFNEVRPKSEYVCDGDPIEKEMFESFMSQYVPNKYGVNHQSVTVTNIKEIHFNGNEYIVNNNDGVEVNNVIFEEVNP